MAFLGEFGTHAVTQMKVGGRWGWQMEFRADDYQALLDDSVDVSAGIKFAGLVSAGVKSSTTVDTKTMQRVTRAIAANQTFNVGGAFNPDVQAWMKSVRSAPMPLHLTLTSVADLLTSRYVPSGKQLDQKRRALEQALASYCSYRQRRDPMLTCVPPIPIPDPTPRPIPSNAIARICVRNEAGFVLVWTLSGGGAVTAQSPGYPAGQEYCLGGEHIQASRGSVLQCHAHAVAGVDHDCEGTGLPYDARSNLQANYQCGPGTTTIYACSFTGLTVMSRSAFV